MNVLEINFYFFLFYYVCMCGLFGYSCYKERMEERMEERKKYLNTYKKVELNNYKITFYNTKDNIEYSEQNVIEI
jgi:hypothetical protein